MQQLIPGAKLDVLRHGSHCPQMDLPELVNVEIERFLAEIGYESGERVTGAGNLADGQAGSGTGN